MRALVVYESMFGNTQAVAAAIAQGLATRMSVDLSEVAAAPDEVGKGVDLVVVGGPTHAFSMSRPGTRQSAAEQANAPLVSAAVTGRQRGAATRQGPTVLISVTLDLPMTHRPMGRMCIAFRTPGRDRL